MKNIVLYLLSVCLIVVILGSLVGCDSQPDPDAVYLTWIKCGELERGEDFSWIYYDPQTRVMYAWDTYTCTALLNADGTPMLYEKD